MNYLWVWHTNERAWGKLRLVNPEESRVDLLKHHETLFPGTVFRVALRKPRTAPRRPRK